MRPLTVIDGKLESGGFDTHDKYYINNKSSVMLALVFLNLGNIHYVDFTSSRSHMQISFSPIVNVPTG